MMMMTTMIVDVVAMMMWLTWWLRWWCGCHDGAKAHVADLTVHFVDLIFHKFSVPFSFFTFYLINYLMMMWFTYECEVSLQSRAPFADLIFPKCSEPDSFLRFLCDFELSLQSRAPFAADLIFQKSSTPHGFLRYMWNRAPATVLCAF